MGRAIALRPRPNTHRHTLLSHSVQAASNLPSPRTIAADTSPSNPGLEPALEPELEPELEPGPELKPEPELAKSPATTTLQLDSDGDDGDEGARPEKEASLSFRKNAALKACRHACTARGNGVAPPVSGR